jgi:type III secretion protein U
LDASYQKYSYIKKLKMSQRDIKEELKNTEGDPHIKSQRRQFHKEISEQSNITATQNANVLLVNPSHYAVAILYDSESQSIPIVAAKAVGDAALAMRQEAETSKIPVLRNIDLTRHIFSTVSYSSPIPNELFDIIAEILVWAKQVKTILEDPSTAHNHNQSKHAPGEDLTRY